MKVLENNKEIIILQADKGKAVVVMDADQYTELCDKLVRDVTTYTHIGTSSPTKKMKGRIQRKVRQGHKEKGTYTR